MDHHLTEEQRTIRDLARRIAEEKVKPVRAKYDAEGTFPWDIVQELAKADLFRTLVPVEYDGLLESGYGITNMCIVTEELSKACAGIALAFRVARGPALTATCASVAAFDFFFVEPRYTFAIANTRYLLTFAVMTAIATGWLNDGTVTQNSGLTLGPGAAVLNHGEWTLSGNGSVVGNCASFDTVTFTNNGLLRFAGGGQMTFQASCSPLLFSSTTPIECEGGTTIINCTASSVAGANLAAGAILRNQLSLTLDGPVNGQGTLEINGGTTTLNAPLATSVTLSAPSGAEGSRSWNASRKRRLASPTSPPPTSRANGRRSRPRTTGSRASSRWWLRTPRA